MSLHFDLVLTCDLREDTSPSCIELISWLCNADSNTESPPLSDCLNQDEKELINNWNFPFLASDSDQETMSVFRRRYRYNKPANVGGDEVHKYALQFSARDILDDGFYDCYLPFVYWLARISENGFVGYYKEEYDDKPTLMFVKDGELITIPENR